MVRTLGLSQSRAGLVASAVSVGSTLSWPLAGLLSDRLGVRKPVYLGSQLGGLALCLVFAFVVPRVGTGLAWTAALGGGILLGGMILPFVTVMELLPAELAATASGVANCAWFVGAMFLPIVLGRVVDVTGGFSAAFLIAAASQAAAVAFGFFIREPGAARAVGIAASRGGA